MHGILIRLNPTHLSRRFQTYEHALDSRNHEKAGYFCTF